MGYKIKSLPLLRYYGEHQDELDFYFKFKKRLTANEYSYGSPGSFFEQFYYQAIIFERLHNYLPRDVIFVGMFNAAREKLTQLLIVANTIINHTNSLETQINRVLDRKFQLSEEYFIVLNSVELFIFKLISFLDVLSNMSAYFFKLKRRINIPNKYGKQKSFNETTSSFHNPFDLTFQERLLKNKAINDFHKYRNKFSHKKSLKLIPYFRNDKWTLTFSEGNKQGIKINEGVKRSIAELFKFINFFEKYYLNFLKR